MEENLTKIFNQLLSLSEQGNIEATHKVGLFYFNGLGVEKNKEKAFEYIYEAAQGQGICMSGKKMIKRA